MTGELTGTLAAGLAAGAVALALRPRHGRLDALQAGWASAVREGAADAAQGEPDPGSGTGEDALGRHRLLLALLAAVLPTMLLGGGLGLVAGAGTVALVWRVLGARESTRSRRRRERLAQTLPQALDLLAVTLTSGASPTHALGVVARTVDEPLRGELGAVERSLVLGRDPVRVWREVADRPGLAPLGRGMVRALETGAPVADSLQRLADDLQSAARLDWESRARTVGVRAAAPLGLCLLPAFVLVGVVPLVGSTVAVLLAP